MTVDAVELLQMIDDVMVKNAGVLLRILWSRFRMGPLTIY